MSDKWTKAQIAFARTILKWRGCGSEEDSCQCYFSNGKCPFLIRGGIGPSYEKFSDEHAQLIKKLIAQHEHDEDKPIGPGTSIDVYPPDDSKMGKINLPANMPVHDYWRYQFAGMAMQGMMSNSALERWSENVLDARCKEAGLSNEETAKRYTAAMIEVSAEFSDALVKKLEEKK